MREEILQEKIQALLDAAGNGSKVEIIDFTKNTVFTKIDTKGFIEFRVYDVENDTIFDLAKDTTSIKSAYQFFLGRTTSILQLNKAEFANNGDFNDICDVRGSCVHREGTHDEYATFKVLDRAEV